jgi:hypothetical protein
MQYAANPRPHEDGELRELLLGCRKRKRTPARSRGLLPVSEWRLFRSDKLVRRMEGTRSMIYSVHQTAELIRNRIAAGLPVIYTRFGDGEIRLMNGENCVPNQPYSKGLAQELRHAFNTLWAAWRACRTRAK